MTTDSYDYLVSSYAVLELDKLFKIEYLAESPIRASFTEIFEPKNEIKVQIPKRATEFDRVVPQEEIKAQIPIQIGETDKFDVENIQEYFTFEDDNRTV